uniref:metallophosphoesterase n=1 Tax=Haliangium sp. TaxID=2663208 RepID=UPI003D0A41F6
MDLRALDELLRDLFDDEQLRRFVRFLPGGKALDDDLPAPGASLGTLSAALVQALERQGKLGHDFFDALGVVRDRRLAEVEAVRMQMLGAPGDAAGRTGSITGSAGLPRAPGGPGPTGSSIDIDISRLPRPLSHHFRGRTAELAALDAAWANDGTRVISIVAEGGAGKSALVQRWLTRLADRGWDGARVAFAWSFYSQGAREATGSSEQFFDDALRFFGDRGPPPTTASERARRLAARVRSQPTLLVLDGVEPLQYGPGAVADLGGRFQDWALRALLDALCSVMNGLCVLTTRVAPTDLAAWRESCAPVRDLGRLSESDGAALLADLGAEGTETERRAAVHQQDGHAFTLTLLGTYVRDTKQGDLRRRDEIDLLTAARRVAGNRAGRMLATYDAWFDAESCPVERAVLRLVGLFDRPADGAAVAALRREPVIPGLTEAVVRAAEDDWEWACARLRRAGLIERRDRDDPGGLDAHPLVRAGFGEMLHDEDAAAWRGGHRRLYEHYRKAAPEQPDTLAEMTPLLHAVGHGCRAGRRQEACDEVYRRRICRDGDDYLWKQLGAFGAGLSVLAGFFEHLWDRPSAELASADQSWVLHNAGVALRALGRLTQAHGPMRAGLERSEADEDWENAAIAAGNMSQLALTLGRTAEAVERARHAVALADRSDDMWQRSIHRSALADAQHQAGALDESRALFAKVEVMQAERQAHLPRLYSVEGYWYCDLVLGQAVLFDHSALSLAALAPSPNSVLPAESPALAPSSPASPLVQSAVVRARQACEVVLDRASYALEVSERNRWLLDIALYHLALGRAHLGLGLVAGTSQDCHADATAVGEPEPAAVHLDQARAHLDHAVTGLRQAGRDDYMPRGLLARAALHRLCGEHDAARVDLAEVRTLAERGPMPLFACDAHLEHARLALALGDPATAQPHVDRAADLIAETGYHRRDRELAALLAGSEPAPDADSAAASRPPVASAPHLRPQPRPTDPQTAMHKLRILHLSDLHIRGDGTHPGEAARRAMVLGDAWQRNLEHIRAHGGADLVCFTGDIAFAGEPVEYEQATVFVDQVLDALGLDRSRLFLVPGNHDVARGRSKPAWDKLRGLGHEDRRRLSRW